MKLNVGCGKDVLPGYINVDCVALPGVDVIHNLNYTPYPFPENSVTHLRAIHVVEHLDKVETFMQEAHRILKPLATMHVVVPFFNHHSAFQDTTHQHFFTLESFDYYTEKSNYHYYQKPRFSIVKKELKASVWGRWIPSRLLNMAGMFIGELVEEIRFTLRVEK